MTIILENISKSYDGKKVLENLNVEIEDGRCYAFVGPKGAGKTTALKIFMGMEKPDEGKVCRMGDYKYPTLQSAYVSQDGQLNLKKDVIWNVKKAHRWASKGRAIEELTRFIEPARQSIQYRNYPCQSAGWWSWSRPCLHQQILLCWIHHLKEWMLIPSRRP